jgi:hypothetical protein
VKPRRRNRLFHAIVGLGLVAASCGGKEQTQTQTADAGQNGEVGGQTAEAATELDAIAMADVVPDRGHDVGPDVGPDVAADVAADVAEEVWHPIVIQ